jgi:ferric-dicitrate binding protein FerR (iron transport regulator)
VNGLARVANISPDEARSRLNQVEQQYRQTMVQAKQQATRAAEVSRQTASRAGIFGFIALVLGAIAAWYGGGIETPHQVATALGIGGRKAV